MATIQTPHQEIRRPRRPRYATMAIYAQCLPRHRHGEFLRFLRVIDRQIPKGLQIHLIPDNYGNPKHAAVQA
jgi:hypothetical protein